MASGMHYLVGCAALALAASLASPAAAQTAAPAPQTAPSPAQPDQPDQGLGDIVITAQRQSESLQRAALPVDVVSADDLSNAGVVTAQTLNAAVPALVVQPGGGANAAFFIRGVGNFTSNAYSDPAIAFNLDGVYLGRPTSTTGTFYDLERIEVLKGPQGTLYGRNATGGAINVIPVRPQLGETSVAGAVGFGNYSAWDVDGAVNLAIGADAALRVSGKVVDRAGYNDDGTSDEKGQALRGQLLVKPTPQVTLRIAADYSHQGGRGNGYSYIGAETFTPGSPATATSPANYTFQPAGLGPYSGLLSPPARQYFSQLVVPGAFINPEPLAVPRENNRYWGVTSVLDWQTPVGTLTLQPAYRRSTLDNRFNGPSFRAFDTAETDRQFSLEARFAGTRVGPVDWLIGGYYFDEHVAARYAINQYQIASYQNFVSRTTSYAAFGRVTAHLSDTLRLVAGGRYTQDDKNFTAAVQTLVEVCAAAPPPFGPGCFGGPSIPVVGTLAAVPGGPIIPGPAGTVPYGTRGNLLFYIPNQVNAAFDKGRFTYRLAGEYDLGPRSLLYASYETGYRSGGFSTAIGREVFQPEYIRAWTMGSKNRFLDNRLQLNVEAFWWKYRNQQISHFGIDGSGNNNFFTENIGRSTIRGIDLDGQVLLTRNTKLSAMVQYLDATIDRFAYQVPRGPTAPPPVTGCSATPTTANGQDIYVVDCSGKQGFNASPWVFNGAIEQTIPLGTAKVVLDAALRYRADSVIGFDFLPQERSGNNTTIDLSAAVGALDDRWSVRGYVRNLTNRAVPSFVQFTGTAGNVVTAAFEPPRSYGIRLSYKFQ